MLARRCHRHISPRHEQLRKPRGKALWSVTLLQTTTQHQEITTSMIEDTTGIATTQELINLETHKQWSKSPTTTVTHLTRSREETQHTRRT
jgi:hypothetical protein